MQSSSTPPPEQHGLTDSEAEASDAETGAASGSHMHRDISTDHMDETVRGALVSPQQDGGDEPGGAHAGGAGNNAAARAAGPAGPVMAAAAGYAAAVNAANHNGNGGNGGNGANFPRRLARPVSQVGATVASDLHSSRRQQMLEFATRPIPQGTTQFCRIVRRKDGIRNIRYTYELYLEVDNTVTDSVLFAYRLRSQTSCYAIVLSLGRNHKARGQTVAKVRSNFLGTGFSIHGGSAFPGSKSAASNSNNNDDGDGDADGNDVPAAANARRELCAVTYEPNFLGHKGPRKMTIVLPPVTAQGVAVEVTAQDEKDTLLERHRTANDHDLLVLHNKPPQWNDETQSFVLNFNGRVALASVKNFQIVHDHDLDYIALQFGRVTDDTFTIDVQYPFSLVQAFGIALTSFDAKLACE
ncbi:tubby C-terminal-like domain-containing protein [Entophlyctis helioformis]|nr:tubby C-terminal-like domain-containing protein [Entophlyctis helioformis]